MKKTFDRASQDDKMKRGPKALVTPTSPLNIDPNVGGSRMSHSGHYTDSTSGNNPEQNGTWKSIGALVRALAEKSGGAK